VPIRSQSAAPARRISDCEHTMLPRRLNRQRTTSDILPAHGLADREPGAPGCSQPRSGRCLSSPIQPQIGTLNRIFDGLPRSFAYRAEDRPCLGGVRPCRPEESAPPGKSEPFPASNRLLKGPLDRKRGVQRASRCCDPPACASPFFGQAALQPRAGTLNRVLQQLGNRRTVRPGLQSPPPIGAGICRYFGCCLPEPSCRPPSPVFGRGDRGELAPPRIPGVSPARTGPARKLAGAKHSCKARERERRYTPWVWGKKRRRSSGAGCFGRCRGR